ncbi:UNVERIFIED_CONTAM: Transcription initiation factor IIB [Sesamum radiatum]|uniref:Transcription initiation factor IIB n=1 Tax=Sesamum radiatum TaxID=300843 RepID=A0AAW2NA03_SESRA
MSEESYCMDCRRRTTVVLDRASGDAVCLECGLVLESRFIDETAEWRNFADDSGGHDPNRVGSPVNPLLTPPCLRCRVVRFLDEPTVPPA